MVVTHNTQHISARWTRLGLPCSTERQTVIRESRVRFRMKCLLVKTGEVAVEELWGSFSTFRWTPRVFVHKTSSHTDTRPVIWQSSQLFAVDSSVFLISAENQRTENSRRSTHKCVPASAPQPQPPLPFVFKRTPLTLSPDTEMFTRLHRVFLKRWWGGHDGPVERWTFWMMKTNKQLACGDNGTKWLLVRVPWVTPW